jgi:hypothetical protein
MKLGFSFDAQLVLGAFGVERCERFAHETLRKLRETQHALTLRIEK